MPSLLFSSSLSKAICVKGTVQTLPGTESGWLLRSIDTRQQTELAAGRNTHLRMSACHGTVRDEPLDTLLETETRKYKQGVHTAFASDPLLLSQEMVVDPGH